MAMTKDQQFFYDRAGSSYNPKTETEEQGKVRGAVELARAESYGKDHGWQFTWEHESDPDLSWMSPEELAEEHECLYCLLKDESGKVLESLGGIVDADRNYGRVIEAELALEALSAIETELAAIC